MLTSIRSRFLIILVPAVLGTWLFAAIFSFFETREEVEQLLDTQLALSGRVMLAMAKQEIAKRGSLPAFSDEWANSAVLSTDYWQLGEDYEKQMAFQIWIKPNTLILRSENAPASAMTRTTIEGFSVEIINNKHWRVFSLHSEDSKVQIHIGEEEDIRGHLTSVIVWKTLIPLLASLPLLAALIWFGVGQGMAPLTQMAKDISQRRSNELRPIDDDQTPKEVQPLVKAMNRLFSQFKAAFDMERRFTADAAHELRTPMAALKVHAEMALQTENEDQRRQSLRQAVRGVNRSTHLVEQLLTLARLDPDTSVASSRRFDLFITCESVISDEATVALEKDMEIGLSGTRGKFIAGNQDAINVLTRNLVDNAIRYTPEKGKIDVNVKRQDNYIILIVADSGPGIPPDERERVFQRFYRQLGNTSPGSGLGLSIVSRIAELHHLDVMLKDSPLGGLQVEVWFVADDGD